MPLPLSRTTEPTASSQDRFGADARPAVSSQSPAGRASETVEQYDQWLADCVRRHGDGTTGLGLVFAEPGEMERRAGEELWSDRGSTTATVAVTLALVGFVALATSLILGWVS